ncbi:amidohydrolase [Sandaracinobacteroides saxicola]|uniref:Amidohydrolase n=2 Tax=Sandaracinobacteroides saxicola TaxID=2759707 RepID=A0A7G5IMD5_9SPHN|nr:M20 family metallopeptidase [Sandaracinobacteroides saxicola]QMW24527.1 amidohydrolase [Sandaracinobacteroides saxicola]
MTEAQALLPQLSALRRAIHREPELGLFTPKTMAKVREALADLPLEWRQGSSTSGQVAILRGHRPGRRVLLRGDMDALPLQEETGLAFASQTAGAMHACGHDSHAAMLAGAARLLCAGRDTLCGEVLFMFQPGEEGYHGARFMLEDGLLDPLPDAAFALHMMPNAPHGRFSGRAGPLLASSDKLTILVHGAGGHASMPHHAVDPVPIACEIVCALQAMVTRQFPVFDPVVVTIAEIKCGNNDNVIAPMARLHGTIRTLSAENRRIIVERITTLASHIACAHRASAEISIEAGFPVTLCDAEAVGTGKAAVTSLFGDDAWHPMDAPVMGAEDFSYVLQKVPGAMFFLGAAEAGTDWRSCCGLHSNHMVLDENVMPMGAAWLAEVAHRFLERGFAT